MQIGNEVCSNDNNVELFINAELNHHVRVLEILTPSMLACASKVLKVLSKGHVDGQSVIGWTVKLRG